LDQFLRGRGDQDEDITMKAVGGVAGLAQDCRFVLLT
jgi:hypothetical protein